MSDVFVVLDYDGIPLDGTWPTPIEAIDEGLLSKYLLSGYEVAHRDELGNITPVGANVYLAALYGIGETPDAQDR